MGVGGCPPPTHPDRSARWVQLEINVLSHYCLISLCFAGSMYWFHWDPATPPPPPVGADQWVLAMQLSLFRINAGFGWNLKSNLDLLIIWDCNNVQDAMPTEIHVC